MVNYKVQATGDWASTPSLTRSGSVSGYAHSTYEVVEVETDQIIKSDMTKDHAKSVCRHLNFGGGFDGWTPAFFIEKSKKCFGDTTLSV